MAASTAAKNRKLRQDTLREYITERGSIQYLFDLIEKIEGLDPDSSTFTNDLQKYKAALDARIKMAGKYLPDLKAQEIEHSVSDDLVKRIERTIVDSAN